MKSILLSSLILASVYSVNAQNVYFGPIFDLDISDPCSISGSFEISYDDEGNASYPNTGPFVTYIKLINTSNQDEQTPATVTELSGINSGSTQGYSFNNVDVASTFGFVPGQEYRIELHIDPGNQVYESNPTVPDTMTIGYVSCTPLSIEELITNKKSLAKILDLTGRETLFKPNTILFYIYSDGTSEKVFVLED